MAFPVLELVPLIPAKQDEAQSKRSEHVFMQVFNDLNIIGVIVCHHVQNVTPEFGQECFSECLTPNKPLLRRRVHTGLTMNARSSSVQPSGLDTCAVPW